MRKLITSGIVVCLAAIGAFAQTKAPIAKTLFYDSDGNLISNNEFVDIRIANSQYPDRTLMKTLDDGTVEFRLQKIPQEGAKAPEYTLRTIDGETVSSTALRGKVVVLNFWFIGCPVCRALKPKLNTFKAKFDGRDDVVFIAATYDPPGEVAKFAKHEPLDYIQTAGAEAELKKFVFNGYPKNIVISKTGEIVYWRSNIYAWDKFESVVRGELAK
ncbi:MAG TPA: TlpA disulfide reductase family protein [Pyrinomonadaceae bacterium]|nr:TlpA disulfide reductase family protein [Pyrinomonadaceae bacterium]